MFYASVDHLFSSSMCARMRCILVSEFLHSTSTSFVCMLFVCFHVEKNSLEMHSIDKKINGQKRNWISEANETQRRTTETVVTGMWQTERHNGSFVITLSPCIPSSSSFHASNVIAINVIRLEVNYFPFHFGAFWFNALFKSQKQTNTLTHTNQTILHMRIEMVYIWRVNYTYIICWFAHSNPCLVTLELPSSFRLAYSVHHVDKQFAIVGYFILLLLSSLLEWISRKREERKNPEKCNFKWMKNSLFEKYFCKM